MSPELHDFLTSAEVDLPPIPPHVHVVDLRDEPCVLRPRQWTAHVRRDPAKFRGVVLHEWDSPVGTEGRLRQRYGSEAEALGRRGAFAPYTISCGVGQIHGEPVVSLAHPLERYTYASDSACGEYLSIGVMGAFPFTEDERRPHHTVVTPALVAAVHHALSLAVQMLGEAGAQGGPPWSLITHRQGVNGRGDHDRCPGEAVVAMALSSEVVASGLLVPDPDLVMVEQWGRPWPDAWRRHLPTIAGPVEPPAEAPRRGSSAPSLRLPPPPQVDDHGDPQADDERG